MNTFQKLVLLGLTALVVIAVLVGCDQALGGEAITPTQDIQDFTVRLNIVPENKIRKVCDDLGTKYDANGCNAFHKPANFCDIYVAMPRSVNDTTRMEIIGHELLHCRYGEYHQ